MAVLIKYARLYRNYHKTAFLYAINFMQFLHLRY